MIAAGVPPHHRLITKENLLQISQGDSLAPLLLSLIVLSPFYCLPMMMMAHWKISEDIVTRSPPIALMSQNGSVADLPVSTSIHTRLFHKQNVNKIFSVDRIVTQSIQ